MILSGEKNEEYRHISKYWINRLVSTYCGKKNEHTEYVIGHHLAVNVCRNKPIDFVNKQLKCNDFDTITFSNGYSKSRRQFEIKLNIISINKGDERLGAEPDKYYFCLNLGSVVDSNC